MKNKRFFIIALVGVVGLTLVTKFLFTSSDDEIDTKKNLANEEISTLKATTTTSTETDSPLKKKSIDKYETSLVLDPHKARIAEAIAGVHSEDVNHRVMSIQTLVAESPHDVITVIYELLGNMESDPLAEGMVALSVLSLANNPQALPNEELTYIYRSYENDNLRARAARVLAHRGDDHLLLEFVKKYEQPVGDDLASKNKVLLELANLQSQVAVPYISEYLKDSDELVRLQALGAIEMNANIEHIELIRPLLYDKDEAVRQFSREVMNNLVARGKEQPVPMDILLHPGAI
jgi:hypothetical protein